MYTNVAVGPPGSMTVGCTKDTNAAVGPPGGGLWTVLQRLMLQWCPQIRGGLWTVLQRLMLQWVPWWRTVDCTDRD